MKVLCSMLQRPFLSWNTRHNSGSQQNLNIPPFLSTFSFSFTISVSSNLSKMLLSLWLDQFLVFAIREMFFFPTHTWGRNINIPLCSPTGCCSPTQHALSLWIVVPYSQLVNQDAISKAWVSDAEEVVQLIVQKRVFNRLACYFFYPNDRLCDHLDKIKQTSKIHHFTVLLLILPQTHCCCL